MVRSLRLKIFLPSLMSLFALLNSGCSMEKFTVAEQVGSNIRTFSSNRLDANLTTQAGVNGDATIQAHNVMGATLSISTSHRVAGAIDSVIWNGYEFINRADHGRELQSASSFDGLGECFNPTEAGSERDDTGPTSTSVLLSIDTSNNELKTTSLMAFWTSVGGAYPQGCGGNPAIKSAQNTTNLSNHKFSKKVSIGFAGISNVIEYLSSYEVSEDHGSGTFESVTGYLGGEFSSFWTLNPGSGQLSTLSSEHGEQRLPVILSTGNQAFAMGVYSPDQPQLEYYSAGYGRFNFPAQGTMKFNSVFRTSTTPRGVYNFRNYIIIGNLSQVSASMMQLHHFFHPEIGAVKPVNFPQAPAISEGLFSYGQTVYYSNGSHYCGFDTMSRFTNVTGRNSTVGIRETGSPSGMIYDGLCGD